MVIFNFKEIRKAVWGENNVLGNCISFEFVISGLQQSRKTENNIWTLGSIQPQPK